MHLPLIKLAPLVALVVVIGTLLFIFLGSQLAPHPALVDFAAGCADRDSPCWRGIVVGVTDLSQVSAQLLAMGYTEGTGYNTLPVKYYYSDTGIPGCIKVGYLEDMTTLISLSLYCMENLTVGDAVSMLGDLQTVVYQYSPFGATEFLSFSEKEGLGGILLGIGSGWDSLYRPVTSIDIYPIEPDNRANIVNGPWRGPLPKWRYCQLVPSYPRC